MLAGIIIYFTALNFLVAFLVQLAARITLGQRPTYRRALIAAFGGYGAMLLAALPVVLLLDPIGAYPWAVLLPMVVARGYVIGALLPEPQQPRLLLAERLWLGVCELALLSGGYGLLLAISVLFRS